MISVPGPGGEGKRAVLPVQKLWGSAARAEQSRAKRAVRRAPARPRTPTALAAFGPPPPTAAMARPPAGQLRTLHQPLVRAQLLHSHPGGRALWWVQPAGYDAPPR